MAGLLFEPAVGFGIRQVTRRNVLRGTTNIRPCTPPDVSGVPPIISGVPRPNISGVPQVLINRVYVKGIRYREYREVA